MSRVTRPLRALGRGARAMRRGDEEPTPALAQSGGYDAWLEPFHDDVLAPIDAACAAGGPDRLARFSELGVWNGASGVPLADSRVLDFGCGWGRLTRLLIRDVPHERLHGCDPVESILDVCRASGVPATLARSEFSPERLPFGAPFDLAFAFSVFTHLSEPAHERCLAALHAGLRPGAILVVTVRPPGDRAR